MISVIIPVYNTAPYLKRCVQSVLAQSYKEIELIIIDDGSTDESLDICKKLAESDSRIKVFPQKDHQGVSKARNVALDLAKGKYIFFLDSDDWIAKNTLEVMVRTAEENSAPIVSCGFTKTSSENMIKVQSKVDFQVSTNKEFFLQRISNHVCGKLYLLSLFTAHGVKYPEGQNYEDMATTYKLFLQAKTVAYTDEGLYYYYLRVNSTTQNLSESNIDDIMSAYFRIKKDREHVVKSFISYYDYYLLTVLFTAYSRLEISKKVHYGFRKKIQSRIHCEFYCLIKGVKLSDYIRYPYTIKLLLYRYHVAGILINIRKLFRR